MGTPQFKVGDKVRRKAKHQNGYWKWGDKAFKINGMSAGWLYLDGAGNNWDALNFDLVEPEANPTPARSDGSSTDYYKLPPGAADLLDLIEYKKMSFALGNIFKACYRLGEKEGVDLKYDLNKIIFFAERMKANL